MAIDLQRETVFPLRELPKHSPVRVHTSTGFRWATRGVRSVILETIMVGGTRMTSIEAIERFAQRLSQPNQTGSETPAIARRRQVQASEKILDKAGI